MILHRPALGLLLACVAALGSIQQAPIDIEGHRQGPARGRVIWRMSCDDSGAGTLLGDRF